MSANELIQAKKRLKATKTEFGDGAMVSSRYGADDASIPPLHGDWLDHAASWRAQVKEKEEKLAISLNTIHIFPYIKRMGPPTPAPKDWDCLVCHEPLPWAPGCFISRFHTHLKCIICIHCNRNFSDPVYCKRYPHPIDDIFHTECLVLEESFPPRICCFFCLDFLKK